MTLKNLAAKTRELLTDPRKIFILALLIAGFSTLCSVIFLKDIFRDTANVYAVFAREWGRGNYWDGIATRVPMLSISLAGLLSRCGMEAVKSLTLIGGTFYLLTCFPLRKFLERYVSPLMAAWGCVLYVAAPKMIRFACAPLIDSASIFFLMTAVLFFLRSAEDPKWRNGLIFGVAAGFLAASRGEGFITATALLLGLPLFTIIFRRPVLWKKQILIWIISLAGAFAAVSPYCLMNYSKSGYFVTDARAVGFAKKVGKALRIIPATEQQQKKLFMTRHSDNNSWSAKFTHVYHCMMRAGYEVYWILGIIGLITVIRRKKFKSDYLVLFGVNLLNCGVYLLVVSATRYYLFIIPFYMVFTLTGAELLREFFCRKAPEKLKYAGVAACSVILLLQIGNGLKRAFSDEGHDYQIVGDWIEKYADTFFPDRELLIFAPGMVETAYWSEADHTDGYEKKKNDPKTFRNFDLAVVHRENSFGLEKRKDLERLPDTPFDEDIWIFRPKKMDME